MDREKLIKNVLIVVWLIVVISFVVSLVFKYLVQLIIFTLIIVWILYFFKKDLVINYSNKLLEKVRSFLSWK